MQLNKEKLTKWVEALESGEYNQAQRQLRKSTPTGKDAFCCLGVLCDLSSEDTGGKWEPVGELWFFGREYTQRNRSLPPVDVREWLLDPTPDRDPLIVLNDVTAFLISLSSLNDNGVTFEHIAAKIRKDWL